MSKKDRKANLERESVKAAISKIPPEVVQKLREKFRPEIVDALLAGCDEYDFLNGANYLMECDRAALVDLPHIQQVADASMSINTARVRVREASMHVSDYNGQMKAIEGMIEDAQKGGGGIVVATPDEAKAMASAAQAASKLITDP